MKKIISFFIIIGFLFLGCFHEKTIAFSMQHNAQMEKVDSCCDHENQKDKKCNTNHDCCISSNFPIEISSTFQLTQKVEKQKDFLNLYVKSFDYTEINFFDYDNIIRIISPPNKYIFSNNLENNLTGIIKLNI